MEEKYNNNIDFRTLRQICPTTKSTRTYLQISVHSSASAKTTRDVGTYLLTYTSSDFEKAQKFHFLSQEFILQKSTKIETKAGCCCVL